MGCTARRSWTITRRCPLPGFARRHAVVFIHGGGWMMGTKDFYSHDLMFLPEAGYPIFNIEYPKAPEHPHPRPLRALLAALVFIKRSFPEAECVHLMGDSAGGNMAVMAALLAADEALLKQVDPWCDPKKLPKVASVTSIYGVLDRTSLMQSKGAGPRRHVRRLCGRTGSHGKCRSRTRHHAHGPEIRPPSAVFHCVRQG
jgi:acetyl esterase/lipase